MSGRAHRQALFLAAPIAYSVLIPASAATNTASSSTVLVTVLASAKAPVADLTAKDFKVSDGATQVEISAAEHATDPLSIELIVDNAQPPMGTIPPTRDIRAALQDFVKAVRGGNPDARIGMFTVAGAATPVAALDAPAADLDKAASRGAPAPQSAGAVLEALVDAGQALGPVSSPRRAIVSVDFASPDNASDQVLQSIESTVFQSGATVWAVSVSGTNPETPSRDAVLNELTKMSGGQRQTIAGSTGLQNQLKAIANSLLSQYTLHFATPVGDPKALKIETPKGKALVSSFAR